MPRTKSAHRKTGPKPVRLKIDAPEGWESIAGALARKPRPKTWKSKK